MWRKQPCGHGAEALTTAMLLASARVLVLFGNWMDQ